jgi:O-antigen/teichoic acid export membrane protein
VTKDRGNGIFLLIGAVLGVIGLAALNALAVALALAASVLSAWVIWHVVSRILRRRRHFLLLPILAVYVGLVVFNESVRRSLVSDPYALLVIAVVSFIAYGIFESEKAH